MSGALSHNRPHLPASSSAFDLPTSSSPSTIDPDDGLSPFMLHQRRRPSLLNPKLGHLSLEKRHRSPLSTSFKRRSSRRRKSTSNGDDSESDRDSNKMWISDRSTSTSSESSRNATPPQQPEFSLGTATTTGALFGLDSKPVGDMVGARPSTPPRTSNNSGFDGMEIVPRRRLSLPVRLQLRTVCYNVDLPSAHIFLFLFLLHIDCYRSSSPACSASCPNHGRKKTNSSPRHSSRDFSPRTPATPLPPRLHVHRPIGVDTPRRQRTWKKLQFRARTTTMSSAKARYATTTLPPRPSTFRGRGPPPKVSMATIRTHGTLEAPWGRHTWMLIRYALCFPKVYAHNLTRYPQIFSFGSPNMTPNSGPSSWRYTPPSTSSAVRSNKRKRAYTVPFSFSVCLGSCSELLTSVWFYRR